MGYYTKLKLSILLNEKAPLELLNRLSNETIWKELTGKEMPEIYSVDSVPNLPIEHEFGKTHRWDQIFNKHTTKFDINRRTLKIECDIKAYENIYEKLADWLKPFIISAKISVKGEEEEKFRKLIY